MVAEQSIIVLSVIASISSILLLYYFSFKIVDEYCCLSEEVEVVTRREDVIKPPNWSAILAAKVEYIDRTALTYAQELFEKLGETIEKKTNLRITSTKWATIKSLYLLLSGKRELLSIYRRYNSIKRKLRKASLYFHSGKHIDKYRSMISSIIKDIYDLMNTLGEE